MGTTRRSAIAATVAILAMIGTAHLAAPGRTTPVADSADLAVTKSDSPDPVATGSELAYGVEARNLGPAAATEVTIIDRIPKQTDFLGASSSGVTCERSKRKLTCATPSLSSGEAATIAIQVRPRERGTITNRATVNSAVADPERENDEDREDTTVLQGPTCRGAAATVAGTGGDDTLVGTPARDVIVALGGHDRVSSAEGRDLVCVAGGNDIVLAGTSNDTVIGGTGGDRIKGQAGNDLLRGNRGRDRLWGGRGADLLAGGRGRDRCRGGSGTDGVNAC
ncbi:MAG: hypothetical protein ACRDL3_08345 [Solirubrobacterales bacterium]